MKSQLFIFFIFTITTSLCGAQNPILWGYTLEGGQQSDGIIFNYTINTGTENDKHDFEGEPNDGQYPISNLLKANNGLLYGMTERGGINNWGTIFSYNISTGIEIDLHNFGSGTDGQVPHGFLIQASDSLLYGITADGGAYGYGILFSYNISTNKETDLHDFGSGADGQNPAGSLIQASNGLIYGVVSEGGTNTKYNYGCGIIFSYNISTNNYNILHNFGYGTDGLDPQGSLIQASNGLLYGMTESGGTNDTAQSGDGTIFSYNISKGTETVTHSFGSGTDGIQPVYGHLIQANDTLLYGMTEFGGSNDTSNSGDGIIFSYNITSGKETDIHDFGGGTDGQKPFGSFIQASNGLLYGMTYAGGVYGNSFSGGTIFSYTISTATETDIHDFDSGTDGKNPLGSLIEVDTVTLSATPAKAVICAGSSVKLVTYGATTYTWSPATGLSATTGDSVIASPNVTATYTITGTGAVPTYPTTVTVTVIPNPTITVNTPSLICNGESTTLIASGATTYTWAPATGLSATTGGTVIASPTTTTTYTVIGTRSGCIDTVQAIITVFPAPIIPTFTQSGNILKSSAQYQNQWYLNDTLLVGDTSQYLTITVGGEYKVSVTNEANGCSSASDSADITTGINQLTVESGQLTVYPNPFNNTVFIKINSSAVDVSDWSLQVIDVLGQTVYSQLSLNYSNEIDISGLTSGMYFITVITKTGRAVMPAVKE